MNELTGDTLKRSSIASEKKDKKKEYVIKYSNRKVEESLKKEAILSKANKKTAMRRYQVIIGLMGLSSWSLKDRIAVLDMMELSDKIISPIIQFSKIEESYLKISESIKRTSKIYLFETEAEKRFVAHLKTKTKKNIETSFIIGPFVGDFYVPSLCLVGELEGLVHNHEGKMSKDTDKWEALKELGIPILPIENFDTFEPTIRSFVKNINKCRVCNTLKRKQTLFKIYLYTIFSWSQVEFEKHFGIMFRDVDDYLSRIAKLKFSKTTLRLKASKHDLPFIRW